MKTIPIDLKKLSDVINKEVGGKAVYNELNTKVNDLEKKIPYATTLIHMNQYATDKQNLEKKNEDVDKKYQILVV